MHVSPAALDGAIRLLESPGIYRSFGDMLETAATENRKGAAPLRRREKANFLVLFVREAQTPAS